MSQQIETMLTLQNDMNTKVHPQWREQNFAWHRAVWTELAEMMDHYGWKWWKKQEPDVEQIKLEMVDIFHFGLSMALVQGGDKFKESYIAKVILEEISSGLEEGEEDFRETIDRLAMTTIHHQEFNFRLFGALMAKLELSLDELFKLYVSKNVLNFFRQDHGYKSGEYVKIWHGKEDNEVLMELLPSLDPSSETFKDDVYQALVEEYKKVVA